MNIDYLLSIDNKIYIHKIFLSIKIRQLITFLFVKNIKNAIYNFNKYIVVNLFVNNYIKKKKKQSIIDRFSIKIYIVDNFKINLLLNNNVFEVQRTLININNQIIILINCRNLIISINIIVKKNVNQKHTIKIKTNFNVSIKITIKISISFYNNLSKN